MNNSLLYGILITVFICGSFLEFFLTHKHDPEYYQKKDLIRSLKLLFGGFMIDGIFKSVSVIMIVKISNYALFQLDYNPWIWLLCFLVWDMTHYIEHMLEHHVRFMWAIHVNHHSSCYLNLSTALRSGVFKAIYRYFFQVPIILIGFPIPMFVTIFAIGKLWGYFTHTKYLGKWRILSGVFVTPEHHALHHSKSEENYNKNFGETLIIWDRLFGTFQKKEKPLQYGINEEVELNNFPDIVLHEFKNMLKDIRSTNNLYYMLRFIFGKPGWKPKHLNPN